MIADPFGLGPLLYGLQEATFSLTAAAWAVGPLAEREFELAHEGCSLTTFCKNPLHPGPCKGWKKSLGVNAPGALKAIESARAEKLAARRAKTAEAKSAAGKRVAGLHSPLHAKKALTKHANELLGDNEAKAAGKADKVILNKQEIKKYAKIKDAQVNGIMAKHGMAQDTGLEDRIAEALAKDNETGKDDNYQAVLATSAASLGAHLAVEHCHKGNHKECDDATLAALREEFTTGAEHALKTGDDSQLDKDVADWDAGKLKNQLNAKVAKVEVAKSKLAPAADTAAEEKAAAGAGVWAKVLDKMGMGPSDSSVQKTQADLADGKTPDLDKLAATMVSEFKGKHNYPLGKPETKAAEADLSAELAKSIKAGKDTPKIAAWKKGMADGSADFLPEQGKEPDVLDQTPTVPKPTDGDSGAMGNPKPFNVVKAKEFFAGTYDPDHPEPGKKMAILGQMTKDEYDQLDPDEKAHIDAFLAHMHDKFGGSGGGVSKNLAAIHAKLGVGPAPDKTGDLASMFDGANTGVPYIDKLSALGGVTPAEFQKLSPSTKAKVGMFLDDVLTTKKGPATLAVAANLKKQLGFDAAAPGKPIKELLDINSDVQHGETVAAALKMTPDEFGALSPTEKAIGVQVLTDAKAMGLPDSDAALSRWKTMATGVPPTPASKPISQDAATAMGIAYGNTSMTATKKLAAYEKVTGEEFKALPSDAQGLMLADLLKIKDKFVAPAKKQQAQQHYDYLSKYAGGGAGTGGGGAISDAQKLAAGKATVVALNKLTSNNPSGAHTTAAFDSFVKATGQDGAADALGPFFADAGLTWLNTKHPTLPASAKGVVDSTKDALAADMTTALKGEGQPTPVLNAFEKAVQSGNMDDLENFILAVDSHKPTTSTAPSPAIPGVTPAAAFGPGASNLGTFTAQPSYDVPSISGSHTHDQVLFSAYKSAHKGTVLSHSIEDNYQNLLAVAQHYRGREPGGPPAYSNDLSVLQVASVVDKEISKSLGVANGNVLQKRIADWAATPAGAKFVEDHPVPGAKWVDNLSGSGSGSVEAAKVGLKMGDPVGKRVQKPKAKLNGKAPKFDPTKTADDFKPLQAHEIQTSQQQHMDASGNVWTPGQTESLANYTTGAYHEINPYLRGKNAAGMPVNGISDLGLERIALIQNGMRPLQQDTLLKRGTDWEFLPPEYRSFAGAQKLIGKSVTEDAFMSTTVGGEFGEFSGDVKLFIEAPTGTPAAWVNHISHNPGEHEVVLAAGTKYKILGVTQDGGQVTMRVRVVG